MKKYEIVKSKEKFNYIIKKGNKINNDCFNVFIEKNNLPYSSYGIAVSKKIGNAVMQNKIKRQIRNMIDNNKNLFPKGYNYIIMVKRTYCDFKFLELENKLNMLIRKVKDEK